MDNYIVENDIDNWGDETSVTQKTEAIERAEKKIERLTKDVFYVEAFAEYFSGNGNDRLFLGFVPDLLTATEVLIAGTALDTSWWTFDKGTIYLDPEAVSGGAGDLAELHLRLKRKKVLFPKGINNIKVTGTRGWTTVPAAIKRAAVLLVKAENDSSLYTHQNPTLKSEKLGDYSYTMNDKQSTASSGILEVDEQLKEYIRKKPIMGIA